MNNQKNKTISFVLIMIAAASITGLMTPSLGIDVQAEKDQVENESNYNDKQHESNYNDNKYGSNYNDNYASNEYAKYYDPKDKNVKVEVIKCDNSITNIAATEQKSIQKQEPANVGVIGGFGVQGAEEEAAATSGMNGMNGMDANKLAQLSIDKNTIVVCWSHNENSQSNNPTQTTDTDQQNQQAANSALFEQNQNEEED